MVNRKINTLYFSATGKTEKVVTAIAGNISSCMAGGAPVRHVNFTLPQARNQAVEFTEDDLVVAGVPVIAGRVPNILLKFLNTIAGNGALAVCVVVYGNRNYDDALIEFSDILGTRGFRVMAAGAFIGEHSFSQTLACGRPDQKDMEAANDFAAGICRKLNARSGLAAVQVAGQRPYRDYYRPRDSEGRPVDFRKIVPRTNGDCIHCGLCARICPMGSVDAEDTSRMTGICIKCCACVKQCPVGAKYFDDENFLRHKNELEAAFTARREPEWFL